MPITIRVGKKARINPESEMVWTDVFIRFTPLGVAKVPTNLEESYLMQTLRFDSSGIGQMIGDETSCHPEPMAKDLSPG
jgi:hypothetical protein